jgi:enoyl-[acyl-carrier protein] reductase I
LPSERQGSRAGAGVRASAANANTNRTKPPLAEQLGAEIILPLDVRGEGQLDHVFDTIGKVWGRLEVCLHSIAFCPSDDLQGGVVDCSRDGFSSAMDISVHSFIRTVRVAEPLMTDGGTCMTVSFIGSEKVDEHYNIMGPIKAALESTTRYMASELGPKNIRVHALSPGPLKTRAASGITSFDEVMEHAAERAPTHHLATIRDVGAYASYLASSEAAKHHRRDPLHRRRLPHRWLRNSADGQSLQDANQTSIVFRRSVFPRCARGQHSD